MRSPASEKSCWAAKKVADAIRLSPVAAMWARVADSRVPPMQYPTVFTVSTPACFIAAAAPS